MKRATAWFLILSLIFAQMPAVRADDSDIFGANVQPNVMLALTSSTNMDNMIKSEPYVPGTTYNTPLTYVDRKSTRLNSSH